MEVEKEKLFVELLGKNVEDFKLLKEDGFLSSYKRFFENRKEDLLRRYNEIVDKTGSMENMSKGYLYYYFNYDDEYVTFREWLPNAKKVFLNGDFCDPKSEKFPLQKDEKGVWSICWKKDEFPIKEGQKFMLYILNMEGKWVHRIPAYSTYAVQDQKTLLFSSLYCKPSEYKFKHPRPSIGPLKIYELHVGMSSEQEKVNSFTEFKRDVLPRIKALGYNCLQIMGVAEHAYYGSFGYQVTNHFAVSSRFGSIDEFKELVDEAHGLGLAVIMDLVLAHTSSNCDDGLGNMDGCDTLYFYDDERGNHELWGTKIFDYGKFEVLRFLLSNIRFWMQEFMLDGFRFDGVTSILYHHHGVNFGFTGNYEEYFGDQTNMDGMAFLMFSNYIMKTIHFEALSIAEDVSGFPGLSMKLEDGGVGFDYRLNMAVPDLWMGYLKHSKIEYWGMQEIIKALRNFRYGERVINYVESHDQAIVGDKTMSMHLFGDEIYTNFGINNVETPVIFLGMALHKMARFITLSLGDAYLNFMGNEYGHLEWIDFPREGNNWSYKFCRRQWSLGDSKNLRYSLLLQWELRIQELEVYFDLMKHSSLTYNWFNEKDKIITLEGKNFFIVFNFHHISSCFEYRLGTLQKAKLKMIENSDEKKFGGNGRLSKQKEKIIECENQEFCQKPYSFVMDIPNAICIIFEFIKE